MKKQNLIIPIKLDSGQVVQMQVDLDSLVQLVKEKQYPNETLLTMQLDTDDGESIKVPVKMSYLRSIVKAVELSKPIVPKVISPYLTDMTYLFCVKPKQKLVGRDHEVDKIWFYLSQKKRNNVFLVGPADVGKTAICREVIRQIANNSCPKEFYDTRVLLFEAASLLKVTNKRKFKMLYKMIINFIVKHKDNVILYIDDSFDMLTHDTLWEMLETLITQYNVPVLTNSLPENMQEYFLEMDTISKYVNIINIEEPELNEIEPMIRTFIKRKEKEYGIKAPETVVQFGIFSSPLSSSLSANPGNVINIFEKAFLEAKRKDKKQLDKASILSCYDTDLKHYNAMPISEKRATAYHETGHYLATYFSDRLKDRKVAYVTILPMVWFLGLTESYEKNDEEVNHSREYYLDYVAMLMAGRVAESRIKEQNMGAYSDLKSANDIAKSIIMKFGLSNSPHNHNRYYDYEDFYLLSEEKKAEIDKEIQEIIDEGYRRAEKLISENEDLLKEIAEKLLKEEVISGKRLDNICKYFQQNKKRRANKTNRKH